jgi:multicomponent K+:H+ antiporter subunit E
VNRVLPHPFVSLFVLGAWLLLGQTADIWRAASGVLVAVLLGLAFARLHPPAMRVRRVHLLVPLALHVVYDIVRSNFAVAAIILGRSRQSVTSGFVEVPLELQDRYGLAILSCIITSTPGTIWVSLERSPPTLLIHVLDLVDEDAWVRKIKQRYERPLLEMFT